MKSKRYSYKSVQTGLVPVKMVKEALARVEKLCEIGESWETVDHVSRSCQVRDLSNFSGLVGMYCGGIHHGMAMALICAQDLRTYLKWVLLNEGRIYERLSSNEEKLFREQQRKIEQGIVLPL